MKTQIAVRLESDAVEFIDREVAGGRAGSRADLIGLLIAREIRRTQALADIERMKQAGVTGYPDLEGAIEVAARRRIDLE